MHEQRCNVVFFDRDGVIIEHVPYISRADDVRLVRGAAASIKRLNDLGIPVVVVTNQSGIGRGYFTVDDYAVVDSTMKALLAEAGARIDLTYFCPHAPMSGVACGCRKPGLALYRQALSELKAQPAYAAFIGDRLSDLQAAEILGGVVAMVHSPETPAHDEEIARRGGFLVPSIVEAVHRVLEFGYVERPAS